MAAPEQVQTQRRDRLNLQGGVYGTILATAVTAAYSADTSLSAEQVAAGVAGTVVVFWLAHAYAGVVADGMTGGGPILHAAREELAQQWPMVLSTVPLLVALGLGTVGILSDSAAETAAILVGVVVLAAYGVIIGRRRRLSPLGTVVLASVNALFGLTIVALKVLVH